jgi:hypothetical protein
LEFLQKKPSILLEIVNRSTTSRSYSKHVRIFCTRTLIINFIFAWRKENCLFANTLGILWPTPPIAMPHPIYDDNGVMWVTYQQSFHPGLGGPRRPSLDRIAQPNQDQWVPRQIAKGHQVNPIRPPLHAVRPLTH